LQYDCKTRRIKERKKPNSWQKSVVVVVTVIAGVGAVDKNYRRELAENHDRGKGRTEENEAVWRSGLY
jgi:hypothetical protein